jgi:hypothetical protein
MIFPALRIRFTAKPQRSQRDFSVCGPIVRGDWTTRPTLWAIDSPHVQGHGTGKNTFYHDQEDFLFGGLSPPNKE